MTEPPTFMVALDCSTCAVIGRAIGEYLAGQRIGYDLASGDTDGWMRSRDAARYLALSVDELQRLAAAGKVPHAQDAPGTTLYFKRTDLDEWRRNGGRYGS